MQPTYSGYSPHDYSYSSSVSSPWQYKSAKNYNNYQSILSAYPHLKLINTPLDLEKESQATGIVIRSANDDNVHKAIKYGIWTTTPKNRTKLEQLWQRNQLQGTNTYLFFSVVKSGMFEGVARLASGYHEQTFPFWWQNHTLKFKGYFEIQWIFIKDINYKHFADFYNMEDQEVTKSKDCDMINSETTLRMLELYQNKQYKRWIFMDFDYMDDRELNYVRKMYEATHKQNYGNYAMFDFRGQHQSMGVQNGNTNQNGGMFTQMQQNQPQQQQMYSPQMGMGFMNGSMPMIVPQQIFRPTGTDPRAASNLGFQMNPVSKNKKK